MPCFHSWHREGVFSWFFLLPIQKIVLLFTATHSFGLIAKCTLWEISNNFFLIFSKNTFLCWHSLIKHIYYHFSFNKRMYRVLSLLVTFLCTLDFGVDCRTVCKQRIEKETERGFFKLNNSLVLSAAYQQGTSFFGASLQVWTVLLQKEWLISSERQSA